MSHNENRIKDKKKEKKRKEALKVTPPYIRHQSVVTFAE